MSNSMWRRLAIDFAGPTRTQARSAIWAAAGFIFPFLAIAWFASADGSKASHTVAASVSSDTALAAPVQDLTSGLSADSLNRLATPVLPLIYRLEAISEGLLLLSFELDTTRRVLSLSGQAGSMDRFVEFVDAVNTSKGVSLVTPLSHRPIVSKSGASAIEFEMTIQLTAAN